MTPPDAAGFAPSPVDPTRLDRATSLVDAFLDLVEAHPDLEHLVFLDDDATAERVSFATLFARAQQVHALLRDAGVRSREAVLIVLPTGLDLVAVYLGTIFAGAVPALCAIPSHRVSDEKVYADLLTKLVANARATALCCGADLLARLELGGADLSALPRVLTPTEAASAGGSPAIARPSAGQVATMQFSSGSTGTPKAIVLSHGAMLNNVRAVRDGLGLRPDDVSVNWIPLYHDMGLIDAFLLPILSGCPTLLLPTTSFLRDPSVWLWAIHRFGGAMSWAPNFAYTLCAKRLPDDVLEGLSLATWRIAINASEPVLVPTIDAFRERFRPYGFAPEAMTAAWGLAENVTIATVDPLDEEPFVEYLDRPALTGDGVARPTTSDGLPSPSIGRCIPRCRLEIRDEAGRARRDREVGDVWLASDSLADGYHEDAVATARTFVDGWLRTGDRGYLADGRLFFVARDKDVIIIGGEKFAPHDVEAALNAVPGIREGCAIAFGIMNEETGTEDLVGVAESREDDRERLAEIEASARREVTARTGLRLRHLLLVRAGGILKTTSGKLARQATRERYTQALRTGDAGRGAGAAPDR